MERQKGWLIWISVMLIAAVGCGHPDEAPKGRIESCLSNGAAVAFPIEGAAQGDGMVSTFDGYGCNSLSSRDGKPALHMRPQMAETDQDTHAGLILGPEEKGDFELAVGVTTVAQIRRGKPKPHEVGWLIWDYSDNDHFYYLAAKPNGWELGKRDPKFPGGQRFLITGEETRYPIGARQMLRLTKRGDRMEAWINGAFVGSFTDADHPYRAGRIGVYCEDSDVFFDSLAIKNL